MSSSTRKRVPRPTGALGADADINGTRGDQNRARSIADEESFATGFILLVERLDTAVCGYFDHDS